MVAGQLSLVFLRRIQMMKLVPLGLLLGFGAALLAPPSQIKLQNRSDVLEIWLEPDMGSDVILEEAKLQILKGGSRILSFFSDFAGPGSRSFVFLADPVTHRYHTVVFEPLAAREEGDPVMAPDEMKRVSERLESVDWARLPGSRQDAPQRPWEESSRVIPPAGTRTGLVWAEGRIIPGDGQPTPEPGAGDCWGSHSVALRILGRAFLPLTSTEVELRWQGTEDPGSVCSRRGFCWAATSSRIGSDWVVDRCLPLFERYAGSFGRVVREARYRSDDVTSDPLRPEVSQLIAVNRSFCASGGSTAFLSHTDWERAGLPIFGAIAERKLDNCGC